MTCRPTVTLALAACLALAGAGPAPAKSDKAPGQDKTHGKAHSPGKPSSGGSGSDAAAAAAAGAALAGVLLSDRDRATITRYFQQNPQPATALPPGIARNLARGKPLPPGIARRGVPNALSGQLAIPSGYELQSVGTDVVLIEIGTRIIADILKDAVRK